MSKATCVVVDGPYPVTNHDFDEIPEWVVFMADDEGEEAGKVYTVRNWHKALDLGAKIAKDRKLDLVVDGGPA